MRLGDFTDINFIIFFVVILVIGIVLALVTVFFVISQVQENKYKQSLDYESTTTKIYIIDAKKNRIVAFNKSDMSHKEESDLLTFYNTFHPNDVEKVKNWVFQIMVGQENKEEYPPYRRRKCQKTRKSFRKIGALQVLNVEDLIEDRT